MFNKKIKTQKKIFFFNKKNLTKHIFEKFIFKKIKFNLTGKIFK